MYLETKIKIVTPNGVIEKGEICEVLGLSTRDLENAIYVSVKSNNGVVVDADLLKYFKSPDDKKNNTKISLISCDSGNYEILKLEASTNKKKNVTYEGHSISNHQWINLVNQLGYEIEEKCISDEDMELENY